MRTYKLGSSPGEANARLTGMTSVVLLALILAEIVTLVLKPRNVLTLHDTLGIILLPLVALKLGSTTWKMAGYYIGARVYRALGPPAMFLRLLGPVIGMLTVVLLASGVILVLGPPSGHSTALLVHKAGFYLWLVATGVHLAGHFGEAFRLASKDWMDRVRGAAGAPVRLGAVLLSLALGGVLALALGSTATTYQQQYLQPGGTQAARR